MRTVRTLVTLVRTAVAEEESNLTEERRLPRASQNLFYGLSTFTLALAAPPLAVTLLSEKAPMCDTQATMEIKVFA